MIWFGHPNNGYIFALHSRNEARESVSLLLSHLSSATYMDDIDFDNFDVHLFCAIYRTLHVHVHRLRESYVNPIIFFSECNINNNNVHALLLYTTNIIYTSLIRCLIKKYPFVIYDEDVYCCEEIVRQYGEDVVDRTTTLTLNFFEPVFESDISLLRCYMSDIMVKKELYDMFFEVTDFTPPRAESYFGRVISYFDKIDVYRPQRSMFKEWKEELSTREKELTIREKQFDEDCERYEIEATKWKANQESRLRSREAKQDAENRWCKRYISILYTELMKYNDYNVK